MKKYLFPFILLVLLLSVFPFLDDTKDMKPVTDLPWQIELLPDGSTRVFGIHLGVSRLTDAMDVLGSDMDVAVIAAKDEIGNLEMYYGHYRSGLLYGKLVLLASASEQDIRHWRDNAVKQKPMPSGQARKYRLAEADLKQALNQVVVGITFIPSVNLDDKVVIKRFGEPGERVQGDGVVHYLYPEKGLDIAVYEDAKDVLQYVPPANFKSYRVAP